MKITDFRYVFLLVALCSWLLALGCYRLKGEVPSLSEQLLPPRSSAWKFSLYFALTPLLGFLLSQLCFGILLGFFSFLRGLADAPMFFDLIALFELRIPEDATVKCLLLCCNSPLFLWSAVLGAERSLFLLSRLRGVPTPPGTNVKELALLSSVSVVTGIAFAFLPVK